MKPFDEPVETYMSRALETALPSTDVSSILEVMQGRRLTAIPVVSATEVPVGIVSRTDLVRIGLGGVGLRGDSPALALPRRTAADVMTPEPVIVQPKTSIRAAAHEMFHRSIHRVLVVDDHRLVGVLSTLDLATVVFDARLDSPISAWMTSPVVTVDARQPVAAAIDLIDRLHVSAVVVVEDDWPVGVFSQLEALLARDLPRDTPTGMLLDASMICLPEGFRIYRAAAHASQLDVRRIIATRNREITGIVGGLDFARMCATA